MITGRAWSPLCAGIAGARYSSVNSTVALRVLWTQCSLQVWARVSSSTSVGSRPLLAEVGLDGLHLAEVEKEVAFAGEFQQLLFG